MPKLWLWDTLGGAGVGTNNVCNRTEKAELNSQMQSHQFLSIKQLEGGVARLEAFIQHCARNGDASTPYNPFL